MYLLVVIYRWKTLTLQFYRVTLTNLSLLTHHLVILQQFEIKRGTKMVNFKDVKPTFRTSICSTHTSMISSIAG